MSVPFVLSSGREVRIGASVGISYFTAQANDVDLLVQQADAALYVAKGAARNTVRVFDPQIATGGAA
jgi:predicted signal transduction protein with EAL and GGDEF domain